MRCGDCEGYDADPLRLRNDCELRAADRTGPACFRRMTITRAAIRVPERVFTTPILPTTTYRDFYGNRCWRMVAPAGDLMLWGDATIEDSGQPEAAFVGAREVPAGDLPDDCLVYLLGSRYCETDRLSQVAWDLFGTIAPGWGRVQRSAIS